MDKRLEEIERAKEVLRHWEEGIQPDQNELFYMLEGFVRKSEYFLSLIQAKDEALKVMGAGLEAVNGLMCASDGVAGLHLNGDIAPWAELTTGGQFEEHLSPLDEAVKVWDEIKALSGGEEK